MPDSALVQITGEEIEAIALLQRVLDPNDPLNADEIKRIKFICLACRATMIPIAIKPDMKRVPHFRVEQEHESGCDIDGYEKLAQKRLKNPVSTLAGFPVPYPSQLRLPSFREVTDKNQQHQLLIIADKQENLNRSNETKLPTLKSHWTVTSIKPLVRHFISFLHPQDRRLALLIPGVMVTTYGEVFQKPQYQLGFYYNQTRIYFGILRYTGISFTDNQIRLPLTEGIWENQQPVQTLFLEINVASWSMAQKKVFTREIEAGLEKLKEQKKSGRKVYLWLFFLGQQKSQNNCQFQLFKDDSRLVCCLVHPWIEEPYSALSTQSQETNFSNTILTIERKEQLSPPPQQHLAEESKSLELPIPPSPPPSPHQSKEQLEASSINTLENQQALPSNPPQDQPIKSSLQTETPKLPNQSQSFRNATKLAPKQVSFPTTMPDVQSASVNAFERENQFSTSRRKNKRRNNRSGFLRQMRQSFVLLLDGLNKIVSWILSKLRH